MTTLDVDPSSLRPTPFPELEAIFDADYYLTANPDVAAAGRDPYDHFVARGFSERRSPAAVVDVRFLRLEVRRSSEPLTTLIELEQRLNSVGPDDLFGPAPHICPAWIARQTGAVFRGLTELLEVALPADAPFSLHPGLHRTPPLDAMRTVGDHVARLDRNMIGSRSLFDLTDYARHHRDLKAHADDPGWLFAHLWSNGLVENRLKYLGTSAPRHLSDEDLMLAFSAFGLRHAFDGDALITPREGLTRLPGASLHFDPAMSRAARTIATFAFAEPETYPSLEDILSVHDCAAEGRSIVIEPDPSDPIATPAVQTGPELTDLDLLSGRASLRGRRVVYSVNLGRYDSEPVPPDLPDCDYVMITDDASRPARDDWRVFRSTLRETDLKRRCLWYKCSPHRLFRDHEFSVWMDANVEAQEGADALLSAHEVLSEVATFKHPDRDCVYDEATEVTSLQLDKKALVEAAVVRMQKDGFPAGHGLYETNVLFARLSDLGVRDFFDEWWRLIQLGSRRDQLSFGFAAWRTCVEIGLLDGSRHARSSRFFTKRRHVSIKERFVV